MHKITRLTLIVATLGWCSLPMSAFAAGNPNNGNNGNGKANGNAGHGNPSNGNNGNTKSNGNAGNGQGGGGGGGAKGTPAPIAGVGIGALLMLGAGGRILSRRFRGERDAKGT
jgi:hypothetical protein